MKPVVFSLSCVAGVAVFSSAWADAPKVVATGWDIACVPAAQIVEQADRFAKTGFDGISFKFEFGGMPLEDGGRAEDGSPCNGGVWAQSALDGYVPVFRKAVSLPCLRNSFVGFHFAPKRRIDWRDDKAWADVAVNMRRIAATAKRGGLKGMILDTEDYWRQRQYVHLATDGSFDETMRLARRRGAEVFRGVFDEFPDITILAYWWLSHMREYAESYDAAADMRGLDDLFPAFTDGVLDVMPDAVTFFDGNEYTYHGGYERNYHAQHRAYAELVSPENRRKYRTCFRAGAAIYLDMFTNPEKRPDGSRHPWYAGPTDGSRLNALIDRLEKAIQNSDGCVWVFGERRSFADWKDVKIPPTWEDAFTNGTWDASLPGFAEQLRILKDPIGELTPRLLELERTGRAVNVASEPDRRDPYSVRSRMEGAKHGEWYAFRVTVKSDNPWVWIHPLVKGRRDWSQRQDHVILEPPDRNGVRRGLGFARVRGGATGFEVECSYNRDIRTKIEVLSLSAVRVYAQKD